MEIKMMIVAVQTKEINRRKKLLYIFLGHKKTQGKLKKEIKSGECRIRIKGKVEEENEKRKMYKNICLNCEDFK